MHGYYFSSFLSPCRDVYILVHILFREIGVLEKLAESSRSTAKEQKTNKVSDGSLFFLEQVPSFPSYNLFNVTVTILVNFCSDIDENISLREWHKLWGNGLGSSKRKLVYTIERLGVSFKGLQ